MDIIIDTNIFRKDFKLKDKNYEILIDYLQKTSSNLIMPRIVLEEIDGLYRRLVADKQNELATAYKKLSSSLMTSVLKDVGTIDIELEATEYNKYILKKLNINPDQIIAYKSTYLPELVNRAINRKKPLGESGQQFRDGIMWLTILDYASTLEDKRVVFISDNKNDFADSNESKLSTELFQEAEAKDISIFYFRSLADFCKEHASSVEFIDEKWIHEHVDFGKLESIFNKVISADKEFVLISSKSDLKSNENATGYINETNYIHSSIQDFYVYEKSEGTILLNLTLEFEKEFEIEIQKELEKDRSSYEYETKYNPYSDDLVIEPVFIPRLESDIDYDYKYILPLFSANFVITVKDQKIIDYEFVGWEWG
jgi:hypothetical protein